jgi:PPP family 3-phenylpropionic acid transporter
MAPQRQRLVLKTVYLFYFAAMAALIPFLTLHYQSLGLSGRQIGVLSGIVPLVSLVSASVWSGIADATRKDRGLLFLAIGGSWLSVATLSQAVTFGWLLAVVTIFALFAAPVVPLIDNAAIHVLGDRQREYGRLRMWGAVGWGIVASVMGALIERSGLKPAFGGYLLFLACLLIAAYRLPIRREGLGAGFWSGIKRLGADRQWLLFLIIVLCQGMSMSIFMNFLFLHLEEIGASRTLMGISLTVATISEIPFWFFSDRLLRRWGPRRLLLFSLLAFAVRAFAYGLMRAPWLVLPISILHGPSFSAMWAAGVATAAQSAPEGMGATALGLFSATTFGLGGTLGGFTGGVMYESIGSAPMFRLVGASLSLVLLLYLIAGVTSGGYHRSPGR